MLWQDIVISIAQLCFVFALLPSIRSSSKPATATSVMNAFLIAVIATCLLTLELWFSAAAAYAAASAWIVLVVQKIKIDKKTK